MYEDQIWHGKNVWNIFVINARFAPLKTYTVSSYRTIVPRFQWGVTPFRIGLWHMPIMRMVNTLVHLVQSVGNWTVYETVSCMQQLCTCMLCAFVAHVMLCALVITHGLHYNAIMHNCKLPSVPLSCTGYNFLLTQQGEQEYSFWLFVMPFFMSHCLLYIRIPQASTVSDPLLTVLLLYQNGISDSCNQYVNCTSKKHLL